MLIAQQLMLLVLRNAFDILVLTAVKSETDWNIRHGFRIWAYTDYFGSQRTPLMSVFGVRSECAETPKKKYKKSEIAKKKIWIAAILAGRSEHSKLTKF